ncbi:hypothetical protein HPGCJGGD_2565 [Methylobacterium haplocladii]|nr:hypothetical protein HPGCJGGD_2565 [Methylobacterium haplocladii]
MASERADTPSVLPAPVTTVLRRICALAPDGVSSLPAPMSGWPVMRSAVRNRMFCSFQPMVLKASVIETAPWSLDVATLFVASIVAVLTAPTLTPPPPVTVLSTISALAVPRTALVAMMPPSARLLVCDLVPAVGSVVAALGAGVEPAAAVPLVCL